MYVRMLTVNIVEDFPMFGVTEGRSVPAEHPIATNEIRFGPQDARGYRGLRGIAAVDNAHRGGVSTSLSTGAGEFSRSDAVEDCGLTEVTIDESIPVSFAEVPAPVGLASTLLTAVEGVDCIPDGDARKHDTDVMQERLDAHTVPKKVCPHVTTCCTLANVHVIDSREW